MTSNQPSKLNHFLKKFTYFYEKWLGQNVHGYNNTSSYFILIFNVLIVYCIQYECLVIYIFNIRSVLRSWFTIFYNCLY